MNTMAFAEFVIRSLAIAGIAIVLLKLWPARSARRFREVIAIGALLLPCWLALGIVVKLPSFPAVVVTAGIPEPVLQAPGWTVAACMWLLGILGFLARDMGGVLRLRGLLRDAVPICDPEWLRDLAAVQAELGDRSAIALRLTEELGPAATGIFRRTIVLPAECRHWSAETRRMVLLHEVTHFRRHDLAIHAVVRVAAALQWFNPFAIALLRQIELERELDCDAVVARVSRAPADYTACLLALAEGAALNAAPAAALRLFPRRIRVLECRVRRLLAPVKPMSRGGTICEGLLLIMSLLLLAACAISRQQTLASTEPWTTAEVERRLAANPFPGEH